MLSDTTSTVEPPNVPARLERGTIIGSRYSIVEFRGSGGSSDVYQAIDTKDETRVALKIVREAGPRTTARHERELEVARTLAHPNVVRVLDSGSHDGRPYLVMEFVDGPNLAERLHVQTMLPVDEVIAIAAQTLHGLTAMHDRGVVHRDIKPSNLLLSADGVKIADLGLAKKQDSVTLTSTNEAVGTWAYIAPEQALARSVDHRADLFSLGVLLYECLAGRIPYADRDTVTTVVARLHQRPRNVAELRPDTPAWLADIVMRLLARNPDDRYSDARAVLDAIERKARRKPWLAAAVLALLSLTASTERITPTQIRPNGDGIEMLDGRGRTLWKRAHVPEQCSALVRDRDRQPKYVAVAEEWDPKPVNQLTPITLLDAATGRPVKSIRLSTVTLTRAFADFSSTYALVQVKAVEVDGADLITATFVHQTYYPSFTVVWDLERGYVRSIYFSAGHHRIIGARDVNGDGRKDLLTIGISNKLGWLVGVGAIDVPPRSGDLPALSQSPDYTSIDWPQQNLLWYALLPPAWVAGDNARLVDDGIAVQFPDGRKFTLTNNGFLSDSGDIARRQAARKAAYESLVIARRASRSRAWDAALRATAVAVARARESGDRMVLQWTQRQHVAALIAAGDDAAAIALANEIAKDVTTEADTCFEVASAFQLRHDNEHAVEWYTRGLRSAQPETTGRMRYEFLENAVFALVENREWKRARELTAEVRANFPARTLDADMMTAFIEWQEHGVPPVIRNEPANLDLYDYLNLEAQRMTGDPGKLQPLVEKELRRQPTLSGLVRLIHADLLRKTGNAAAARAESAAACEWVAEHADDFLVRALHVKCAG